MTFSKVLQFLNFAVILMSASLCSIAIVMEKLSEQYVTHKCLLDCAAGPEGDDGCRIDKTSANGG